MAHKNGPQWRFSKKNKTKTKPNNLHFSELKKKERSHKWEKRQSQELEMNTGEI